MLDAWLISGLMAVSPISELRGAIPYAVLAGIPVLAAGLWCTVMNMFLVIPLYLFLRVFYERLLGWKPFASFVNRTQRKAKKYVDKYGMIGLTLFVAAPLPLTGVYTGMIASFVLGMPKKKAMLANALGVGIAGVIITAIVMSGVSLFGISP